MLRATGVRRAQDAASGEASAVRAVASLAHDERHLRRKALPLTDGGKVFVDLPNPVVLAEGDELLLEDGGTVRIEAADELLYEITARNPVHLTELAWHIGNRHLPAAISGAHILIGRDHVIKAMLEGLGATVRDVETPFNPVRGAYAEGGHGHGHDHGHAHEHDHDHDGARHRHA